MLTTKDVEFLQQKGMGKAEAELLIKRCLVSPVYHNPRHPLHGEIMKTAEMLFKIVHGEKVVCDSGGLRLAGNGKERFSGTDVTFEGGKDGISIFENPEKSADE